MRSRFYGISILFCFSINFVYAKAQIQPKPITIAIQPFMPLSQGTQNALQTAICQTFTSNVMFLTPRNLPQYTKIPPRQRYSTPKLLHFLSAHRGSATRIVGITDADITLPMNNIPDWGVFGAANYHSPSAMISRHRLRKNAHTSHTIDERLTRVVVHELGHTFGLPHCPTPRCLMNDAGGKIATIDQASDKFCAICRTKLSRHLPPQ